MRIIIAKCVEAQNALLYRRKDGGITKLENHLNNQKGSSERFPTLSSSFMYPRTYLKLDESALILSIAMNYYILRISEDYVWVTHQLVHGARGQLYTTRCGGNLIDLVKVTKKESLTEIQN